MHDSHMPCRAARRGEAHLVAWDRRQPPTIDAARTTALTSTHARLRKLRPQLGAALAAGGTDEARFDVRQPDVIWPAVGADLDRMAAPVVAAMDQHLAHAGGAHLTEGDFGRAG